MLAIAILTPLCVGLVILFLKEERADAKFQSRNALAAIATTLAVFAVAVAAQTRFAGNYGEAQLKEVWYTFTGAGLNLVFALDGLSMPLFLSTAFLFLIAALFSLNVQKLQTGAGSAPVLTRQFWASLLFLESIVLGVFAAYNFIVFFMLWELFLIPVVVLMWRFGLEERKAAAARFFIYTFVSSAFMLAAFAALVYYTPRVGADFDFKTTFASELQLVHFEKQRLIFLFFIIAFLVKMPVFPFHAWLPLTHTQAPLGTLLLSGLFLKLGSYGVLRFITPNFSGVIAEWGSIFISLGIFSMLYGAFVAYRQQSFRFVIAYSSLSHMGLLFAGTLTNNEYGVTGAIVQNVGHSLANALLFIIVTMHLVRSKSDDLAGMQAPKSFFYQIAFSIALFSAIGVPGTIGFVGEFLMLFGLSFKSWPLTVLAISTLVFSSAYMLRLYHKMRANGLDNTWGPSAIERVCLTLLCAAILWFGVQPSFLAENARSTARVVTAGAGVNR
jgi:NADH-quinone oxidoreductase subunit M